ncbi:helix-turn-helix domain-containing protein [Streptomyces physcomitrii]|uniref:Helix-turn-helix domain-containing protein n=1 Tax=Streptomyces physcomitrii TaxID=2724184 RepID=A0ABX1H075_9ACTN|nr:helix-turn-helix domain-containing protein [Streptomyces physcomitrii]NKI41743.1 helix-turn-helix domain-containing protein [Streptomyces physcomitrii]
MGRPEAHIDPSQGPLQRFANDLRTVRRKAGSPSYESLASRANYSGTTLAAAARGIQLPSLEVTLAYVSACGANPQPWVGHWHRTRAALAQRGDVHEKVRVRA